MKTFVEFVRQGLPMLEASVVVERTGEVSNRDTAGLQIPTKAFGFCFYDKDDSGKIENISPVHYIGGEVSNINGKRVIQFRGNLVTSTFVLKPGDVMLVT